MIKVWHTDKRPSCREEFATVFDPSLETIAFVSTSDGRWVTTTGNSKILIVKKHFCPGPATGGRLFFRAKCSAKM
jgi:hypothetical protein